MWWLIGGGAALMVPTNFRKWSRNDPKQIKYSIIPNLNQDILDELIALGNRGYDQNKDSLQKPVIDWSTFKISPINDLCFPLIIRESRVGGEFLVDQGSSTRV